MDSADPIILLNGWLKMRSRFYQRKSESEVVISYELCWCLRGWLRGDRSLWLRCRLHILRCYWWSLQLMTFGTTYCVSEVIWLHQKWSRNWFNREGDELRDFFLSPSELIRIKMRRFVAKVFVSDLNFFCFATAWFGRVDEANCIVCLGKKTWFCFVAMWIGIGNNVPIKCHMGWKCRMGLQIKLFGFVCCEA